MTIIVYGVDHNECNISKGFRQAFNTAEDADIFIQTQCNKLKIEDLDDYGIYITNEYGNIEQVLHCHYWYGTNTRYQENSYKGIEKVDIKEIKKFIDINYQRQQRRSIERRQEATNRINNMDAAAVEYQRKLFKDLQVKFL